MTERQERRAPGVNRVAVARVVDICGRDATVPAFEAESVEVSGRGMHVKTPYLPPEGSSLVCRLEENGREIVVEGVVSWQREREGGGEFGVQFTALDSGSVEALKHLCGMDVEEAEAAPVAAPEEEAPKTQAARAPAGTPVKLHIDGLGAPMKARVKDGGTRRLHVGSNLEFLKVGRGLEVENVEEGERRGAKIDAVSIAIDPQTQVPQLVVVLKYEGEDTTPEPSVVEARAAAIAAPPRAMDPVEQASVESEPAGMDDEDDDVDADAFRGRADAFAVSMGQAAQKTGERLSKASGVAAVHFMKWMRASTERLGELARRRSGHSEKRRSTAPAPSVPSPSLRRLRPQNGSQSAEPMDDKRKKILIGAGVGALVLASGIGFAAAGRSGKPAAADAAPADPVAAAQAPAAPGAPAAAPMAAADPTLASAGAQAAAPMTAVPPNAAVPGQRPGVVANVPLFGPTPMATLEPAPLEPPPQTAQVTTNAAALVPPATEERMAEDSDRDSASDESFGDAPKKEKTDAKSDKSTEVHPEDVKPFVQGTMHLPIVHRLKLDKPGAALKGTKQSNGFTVVVPGRKIVESGSSITKRDDRIADVRTKNGGPGAQVTFVFRSKVPGYKVRLRKNYVEFFIGSPGGK